MNAMQPAILHARVMHNRILPRRNRFCYNVYYIAVPLSSIEDESIETQISLNRFGLHSFCTRDHGYRDGSSLRRWAEDMLSACNISKPRHITLICMPRISGYVFNPVSFWLCCDDRNKTYAIICEVNNTFGETHSYVCVRKGNRPVDAGDWITASKCFHVSPYLERNGRYRFRFNITDSHCDIQIDYHDAEQQKTLTTSLNGRFADLSRGELLKAFFKNPLVTVKTIGLIHFQAFMLALKKIRYVPKPEAVPSKITCSDVPADEAVKNQRVNCK